MSGNMSSSVYEEYECYVKKHIDLYGSKTVVLFELGSFYEVYSINDGLVDIKAISEVLNIQVTRKNKSILEVSRKNACMCGFPSHCLQKYVGLLVGAQYTVVVVSQITPPPRPQRKVTNIISPGTCLEVDRGFNNSFVMSVFVDEEVDMRSCKEVMTIGVALLDISTGSSSCYEVYSKPNDKYYAMDELYRIILANKPKEINVIGQLRTMSSEEFIEYMDTGGGGAIVHNGINLQGFCDSHVHDINYQNQFLRKLFPKHGLLSVVEFLDLELTHYARAAFVHVVTFAYNHNEEIVQKLSKPVILTASEHLILSYNTARQLNIIETETCQISLLGLLNTCKTAIGKRQFTERVLNPYCKVEHLQWSYETIEKLMTRDARSSGHESLELAIAIGKHLENVYDLERKFRRINMGILHPCDLPMVESSLKSVVYAMECFQVASSDGNGDVDAKGTIEVVNKMLTSLADIFSFEKCAKYRIESIEGSVFVCGMHHDVDAKEGNLVKRLGFFEELANTLNGLVVGKEKHFKVDSNERDGFFLVITSKRFQSFKKQFAKEVLVVGEWSIKVSELESKLLSSASASVRLHHPIFKTLNEEIVTLIDWLRVEVGKLYKKALLDLSAQYEKDFERVVNAIGTVDYVAANARNAMAFKYCRPTLCDANGTGKSYLDAKGLRHPIIERIQSHLHYEPNDIVLGRQNNQDGMLLYGINAVGKSSLMKSVGLSLVMASAGMYVPCKEFSFFPYKHLFTRIPSGDNIGKGQSTFTSEISELRNIMKRADADSLVLGDELCSGTETTSAMAIICAGIVQLSERKSSFIFASHLHDIVNVPHVKRITNLGVYHLSVHYDEKNNKLIYDRKLKKGQGSTLYGLEVLRSLDMDKSFLDIANEVRKGLLTLCDIVSEKKSRYNRRMFLENCKLCGNPQEEVHHIKEQYLADSTGFIGHIHKNALHNLVNVCEECHDKIHRGEIVVKGYFQTSNGHELCYDILDVDKS